MSLQNQRFLKAAVRGEKISFRNNFKEKEVSINELIKIPFP